MFVQLQSGDELLRACATLNGLDFAVFAAMVVNETTFLRKAGATLLTSIRSLTCVRQQVALQVGR